MSAKLIVCGLAVYMQSVCSRTKRRRDAVANMEYNLSYEKGKDGMEYEKKKNLQKLFNDGIGTLHYFYRVGNVWDYCKCSKFKSFN